MTIFSSDVRIYQGTFLFSVILKFMFPQAILKISNLIE